MGKMFWIIVIFLIIGGYMIKLNSNLDLEDKGDQKTFVTEVAKWTWKLGTNAKDTVGYAMKKDWLPKNETNVSDTDPDTTLINIVNQN